MRTQTAKKVKKSMTMIMKNLTMKEQTTTKMTEVARLVPVGDEDVGAHHPQGAEADVGMPQGVMAAEAEDAHDEGSHQRHPGFKREDERRGIGM